VGLRGTLAGLLVLCGLVALLHAWLTAPERSLEDHQAQLASGKAITLIGARGGPVWSRWWMGEHTARALQEQHGTFVVHGWPLTLLELLPGTCGQRHYRIHAEVRHLKGGDNGAVGVYFAAGVNRTAKVPVLSFLQVSYDDLHDATEPYYRLPEDLRKLVAKPKGNRVRLAWEHHAGSAENPTLNLITRFAEPELFKPAGIAHAGKPGEWRTIVVEVSPTRVRIFWEGKAVAELNPARVEERSRQQAQKHRQRDPENPALSGLSPQLELQGGLGLYLYESYASFRHVRVEPVAVVGSNQ
jgi:hypothetical protein